MGPARLALPGYQHQLVQATRFATMCMLVVTSRPQLYLLRAAYLLPTSPVQLLQHASCKQWPAASVQQQHDAAADNADANTAPTQPLLRYFRNTGPGEWVVCYLCFFEGGGGQGGQGRIGGLAAQCSVSTCCRCQHRFHRSCKRQHNAAGAAAVPYQTGLTW